MKRIILVLTGSILGANCSMAQLDKYNTTDLHPVSPTAFQFIKYTEMPVSEYTGVPNITIPLYEINVDEVKIPIQLTYHSQGIRIAQEASWVGLGWDMQMGSIIQNINDRDDYEISPVTGSADVKILPDFFPSSGDGSPFPLPLYQLDPLIGVHGAGWSSPYPINAPGPLQGYAMATNYYVPVNGEFDMPQGNLLASTYFDSEPDIFIASFFGETVKFILDFNNPGNFIVLNKKGYRITKTTNGFSIINPAGTSYFFETIAPIVNATSSGSIEGYTGSTTPGGDTTSKIFLLSKIITKNSKLITFGYSTVASSYYGYLNCSQKLQVLTNGNTVDNTQPTGAGTYVLANFDARTGSTWSGSGTYSDLSLNGEKYSYLQSINFPNGSIQYTLSSRSDIVGAQKLDSIKLKNLSGNTVKVWKLDYSYFDATGVGGNGYTSPYSANLSLDSTSLKRLKLTDVIQDDGGKYTFSYDTAHLPIKNSFAADYWGFYNGQLSNTSFVPNPTTLGLSALGNNGNVKDANLTYAKAGMLEAIQYPTGGRVRFDYELNVFDKNQVIGLPITGPTIQGEGLRIHAISHFNLDSSLISKVQYSYGGGKLINQLQLVRQLNYSTLTEDVVDYIQVIGYTLNELSANSVFASNPLSSVNGVGYDTVTKQNIDAANATTGKTMTLYNNNIDNHNPTIASRALRCSLPSVKSNTAPENGTVASVAFYDNQNVLQKKITNTYTVSSSNIYYGARIFPFGSQYYHLINLGESGYTLEALAQTLIGYIPIFDVETLLSSSFDTTFFLNGNVALRTWNTYDSYNQLSAVTKARSDGGIDNTYIYYPYSVTSTPVLSAMIINNHLSDIVELQKKINGGTLTYEYDKNYFQLSNKFLENNVSIIQHALPSGNTPDSIYYELYDSTNANLLQYRTPAIRTSMIWDYSGQYVVAEAKNADYPSIAYTSFEADGTGNWSIPTSTIDSGSSLTGKKSYFLTSTPITKSGLVSTNKYIVSYWSRTGGNFNVPSNTSIKQGKTIFINGQYWTYFEHVVTGTTSISINSITGGGYIDELRLYPVDAQMTTYTYAPLIGMSASCDVDNRVSYYFYDPFGRLKYLKDQDGNIIKTIEYHYAGQ